MAEQEYQPERREIRHIYAVNAAGALTEIVTRPLTFAEAIAQVEHMLSAGFRSAELG